MSNSVIQETEIKAQQARIVEEEKLNTAVEMTHDATFDEPSFGDSKVVSDRIDWKI